MTIINLTRTIGLTERTLRALLDPRLSSAGLTFPEWAVLVYLNGTASLTRDDLARMLQTGRISADVDDVINGLVAKGWLLVLALPEQDGVTSPPVTMTPLGETSFDSVRRRVADTMQVLMDGLAPADVGVTQRTLQAITQRAQASLAE